MLSDTLIQFVAEHGTGMPPEQLFAFRSVAEKVKSPRTGRYVLDRAAVSMIQNLTLTKRSSFLAALPLCRLRNPVMWVEFAFTDRYDWLVQANARGLIKIQPHPISSQPQRLGFLLEQEEEEETGETYLLVTPLWTHRPPDTDMGFKTFRIRTSVRASTPQELAEVRENFREADVVNTSNPRLNLKNPRELEASTHLESRIKAVPNPLWADYWAMARQMTRNGNPRLEAMMEDAGTYDLASEWSFILALLIALNSRNVIHIAPEVTEYTKLNKGREKKGKLPLLDHRPITLNLSKVQKRRVIEYVSGGRGGNRGALDEACYIPGHWKVRKTGVFWWSEHERGGREPAIGREYKVTA